MPRLFVAINFPENIVDDLCEGVEYLKNNSLRLNPSRKENLHLTLAFIGETSKVKNAVSALKSIELEPFKLSLEGFGEFSSKDGSICFAKAKECPALISTAKAVRNSLTAYGFDIDTKPFKPHVTLCRQFEPSLSFSKEGICQILPLASVPVREISLMRSDRINGKLVYTEVFKKML